MTRWEEESPWTKELIADVGKPLQEAIYYGDCDTVRRIVAENPWLISDRRVSGVDYRNITWMGYAATWGHVDVVNLLIDLGFDIDAVESEDETALWQAIRKENDEILELLLDRGANPNIGRLLILAMTCDEDEQRWKYIKLLVERGIDVNQIFEIGGDPDDLQTALDWCPFEDIAAYLRQHGAKFAKELGITPGASPRKDDTPRFKLLEEVVEFFDANMGQSDCRQQTEIVQTGHPIAIHFIPPADDRQHWTLFTTGLSIEPMHTPSDDPEFAYAELYIQLPGDWPMHRVLKLDASSDSSPVATESKAKDIASALWPFVWLRKLGQYPHDNATHLGGPLTIYAEDDPPTPIIPGQRFTSMMLFADQSFERSDGNTVYLFRLLPLYTEEREVEIKHGVPELFKALDQGKVPFIVDVNRACCVVK